MTQDSLYEVAYVAAAVISFSVGVAAWRRRPAPGSVGLALLSFAQAGWSGVFALQWMLSDHGPSLAWLTVRNIGLFITPIAILMLVTSYVGKEAWLTGRRIVALAVVPLICWVAIPTDPWHGLYLAGVEPTMKFSSRGPMFLLNLVYSYGLILFALGLLAAHLLKRPPYPQQAAVLFLGVVLPVLHFGAQLAGFDLVPRVNTVPFTFTLSGALMWFALTRLGLFRLVPIARDQLIEQLPMGIVAFDADRRIIDINPAAVRMTGASGAVLGRVADEAFPRQLETVHRLREDLLSRDTAITCAEFAPGLWIEATATVLNDRAGEQIATLVTLRDVSERREAERMQRDFVANVAHELQTPLTGLSLLAKTIPRAMHDDPQAVEGFIERLDSEVDRLVHLTESLLTLSRSDVLPRFESAVPTNVGEVVVDQVHAISRLAEAKGQTIAVHIPDDLVAACDGFELGIVVGNLLRNAVRYTDTAGHITVNATVERDDSGNSAVVLTVSDDGIGIPAQDQERIFERFYRVDKARSRHTGGAGLGLSIVKQLTEKNGGSVSLTSTPGAGSSFTVRLLST